jgi:hypothetical protein
MLTKLLLATLKLEQQREVERLREATQAEEKRFQEALRKRQAQPRNLLPHISFSTAPDLEKNSTHQSAEPRSLGDHET